VLAAGQPVTLASIDLGSPDPAAQRLIRNTEVIGDDGDGLATALDQPHGFGPEGGRIGGMGTGHRDTSI